MLGPSERPLTPSGGSEKKTYYIFTVQGKFKSCGFMHLRTGQAQEVQRHQLDATLFVQKQHSVATKHAFTVRPSVGHERK